jgi:acetate---CoA ligase (ADP-forming)
VKAQAMDLAPLLAPRSVAVVGASQQGGRATGAVRNLLELGFPGAIYPINPKYNTVLDLPCYPSLDAVPASIDLVAIGIPSEHVLEVLTQAYLKGVPAAVIFASGYGEAGDVGRKRQAELETFAERTKMLICGPNCLGIINFHTRGAGYSSTSPKDVSKGDVALVSQSGTVVVAMVRSQRGIGFSHMVSCGNEATLSASHYIRYLVDDPNTRVIGAFLEGIKEPEAFVEAAEAARRAAKPLIVVKTGRSALGSAASAAHTGSLAGSHEVQRALFRQKGIVACDDLDEWVEAIELFRRAPAPRVKGIGLIGISGGENALVLDHAAEIGLDIPALSETAKRRLAELLPWYARPENPIDPTGAMSNSPDIYLRCLEVLAAEPGIGIIGISQDSPAHFDLAVAEATVSVARTSDKPFVFFSNISGPYRPEVVALLKEAGLPYLQGIRESLKAMKALIDYHLVARLAGSSSAPPIDKQRREAARIKLGAAGPALLEDSAKSLLGLYNIPVVPERVVASASEAIAAADAFGYPVAAKVLSPDILHKADVGGVRLNLNSALAVEQAIQSIKAAIARERPAARLDRFLIQPMVQADVELIAGLKRDPQFGSTIIFGLGGVFVEAIRQVSIRLAPISEADAREMIVETPGLSTMLRRVASGYDPVPLLAPLLVRLSNLAVELGDDIQAVDLNPIMLDCAANKAQAVDALIIRRTQQDDRCSS